MNKKKAFTGSPVLVDPTDICNAVVGLKGTRVLHYQRQGPMAEIGIEQVKGRDPLPQVPISCQSQRSPLGDLRGSSLRGHTGQDRLEKAPHGL